MDKRKSVKENLITKLKGFFAGYISVEKGFTKENLHERLNFAAKGIGLAVMAFFFGMATLPFSAMPFGVALQCAVGKYVPFAYIGLLTSSLFSVGEAIPVFLMYSMGLLLRFLISYLLLEKKKSPLFAEGVGYRCVTSVAMAFMLGVYRCIAGGFLWYDLFGTLLSMVSAPLLVLLYCGVFVKRNRFTSYHDLGMAALMASCVYSLNGYTVFGFSLSAIAAFGIALYISKECGMLRGGVAGLIAGLAYNVVYAPLFSMAGLVSGLFWKLGTAAATGIALLIGIIYGVYMDGFSSLRLLAPDLLAASLIFTPLAKLNILPKPILYSGSGTVPDNYADDLAVAQKKEESTTLRFKAMSQALTSLSKTFYKLSNSQKKPEFTRVKEKCRDCFESSCAACSRKIICWDHNYEDTQEHLNALATTIYNGERANADILPDDFVQRCPRMDVIISDINKGYSDQLSEALKCDKAEVFAIDYAAMSALLEEAIAENSKEYEIDKKLTQKLKSAAIYLNFTSSNLAVYGKRRRQIVAGGIDLARVKLGVDEIRRSFERVVGCPLSSPEFTVEKGYVSMTMRSRQTLSIETAHASAIKEDEEINGDTVSFFENSEDYFYTLLGDGMGSGRDAALTSRLANVYLDRMLRSGNKKEQAIAMLNQFLRQKNTECFTTVDLLEIDLLNREASFVKSGAAPSYVLRDTSLFKISSNSMPVGITKELSAEEVKFKLEPGDIIVMASDGISESFEDGVWLVDMLTDTRQRNKSIGELCQAIVDEAIERNDRRDDMTVGIIRVTEK